jgi:hypothetical protein
MTGCIVITLKPKEVTSTENKKIWNKTYKANILKSAAVSSSPILIYLGYSTIIVSVPDFDIHYLYNVNNAFSSIGNVVEMFPALVKPLELFTNMTDAFCMRKNF